MKNILLIFLFLIASWQVSGQKLRQIKDVTATATEVNRALDGALFEASEGNTLVGIDTTETVQEQINNINSELDTTILGYNAGQIDSIRHSYSKYTVLNRIGSTIVTATFGFNHTQSGAVGISDGVAYFLLLDPITKDTTVTGLKTMITTSGNFTADNYSGAGLYEVMMDGTYSRIAMSADLPDQLKIAATSATNPPAVFPFTSPVEISKNKLYVWAILYNSSAQTTAPQMGYSTAQSNAAMFNTLTPTVTNARLVGILSGQTTLPETVTVSALAASSNAITGILY